MDITKLYQTQVSLTEWFEKIGYEKTTEFRKEDNDKRTRLEVLNQLIGLPFDRPFQFRAEELVNNSPEFIEFIKVHGQELCALRLIPDDPTLPKLRMRGHTIEMAMIWFREQSIDPALYKVDFVPHAEHTEWATIFIVNSQGIFGEIIQGGHHHLTQGFYDDNKPIPFSFLFNNQGLISCASALERSVQKEIEDVISWTKVTDKKTQDTLKDKLDATFCNDYLCGYFETVSSEEFGLWFIDYNRILGDLYKDFSIELRDTREGDTVLVGGQIGNKGKAQGKVRIVKREEVELASIDEGDVLVCTMTTPEYIPLMKKASAFVTDMGGILCHAAIISRELKKPCIIGAKIATQVLKDGDLVEVDADNGVVRVLEKAK